MVSLIISPGQAYQGHFDLFDCCGEALHFPFKFLRKIEVELARIISDCRSVKQSLNVDHVALADFAATGFVFSLDGKNQRPMLALRPITLILRVIDVSPCLNCAA